MIREVEPDLVPLRDWDELFLYEMLFGETHFEQMPDGNVRLVGRRDRVARMRRDNWCPICGGTLVPHDDAAC